MGIRVFVFACPQIAGSWDECRADFSGDDFTHNKNKASGFQASDVMLRLPFLVSDLNVKGKHGFHHFTGIYIEEGDFARFHTVHGSNEVDLLIFNQFAYD
ncbi:MAG: hypothetical protein EPGJADBJ_02192 [Saprospiraceae bacterium]|nr:hypothetical protein [Saprospiraceae bacterium]